MKAIFAVNALNGFAIGNTMPWPHSTVDLQRFRRLTSGETVIMGRGTWDSDMPKPLPNRRNIVLSNTLVDDRCEVYQTVPALLEAVKDNKRVWVIGGVKTLWALQPHIDRVFISRFKTTDRADVTLDIDLYLRDFEIVDKEYCGDHTFSTYYRITT